MPNVTPLVLKEVRESNPQKKSSSKKSATSKKSKSSKTGADGSDDASRGGKGKSGSRTYESDNNNFAGNIEQGGVDGSSYDGNSNNDENKASKSLLEMIEFYPRAFMDFEVFEIEFFIKPQFKSLNPDVWKNMMK